jgi:hypothetical protein
MPTEMNSSDQATKTPLETLRKISDELRDTSTWENVFRKFMDERSAVAKDSARELDGENHYESVVKNNSRKAFLLVIAGLFLHNLLTILLDEQPFEFQLSSLVINTLLYLIYGFMGFTLASVLTKWFFVFRTSKYPGLPTLIYSYLFNGSVRGMVAFILFAATTLFLWFLYDGGWFVAMLISFWALAMSVLSESIPIRVIYLGPMKQDVMVMSYRLQGHVKPLRAVSCMTTGLEKDQEGILMESSYRFSTTNRLKEKIRKAIEMHANVVVDLRYGAEAIVDLLEVLLASTLPAKPFILINKYDGCEDSLHTQDGEVDGIDGECISESELLKAVGVKNKET